MTADADIQRRDLLALAGFLSGLSLEDLEGARDPDAPGSPGTLERVVLAVLDGVGCGVAGGGDPAVSCLEKTLTGMGETGDCPAFCGPGRYAPRTAALVSGAMIHALEMDDTHSPSSVHAAGPVLAACLAQTFIADCTGARFLEGVAAGYEAACRLGMALRGPGPYHRHFHPTGTCGVFGAAAAVCRLRSLDPRRTVRALGIAGSMASGLMSYLQNGAWTKKMHPGWAAQGGLLAASLAGGDFLGPDNIFEGRYNFSGAYADAFAREKLLHGLGERFEAARMSFKPFACCRAVHPQITAALALREEPGIDPEGVEDIHVVIADEDLSLVVEPLEEKKRPRTMVEAQFSMPFGLALALARGRAMPEDFRDGLDDPLVARLAGLVSYEVSDRFTAMRPLRFPCEVRLLVDGKWHVAAVDAPLGDFTNPMDSGRFREKFSALTLPAIGPRASAGLADFILGLPREPSMQPFFAFMQGGGQTQVI